MPIVPLPPKVLSCRTLPRADAQLVTAFGLDPSRYTSLGLLTCDQDDSLYVALDHGTKFADVDVVFARSFYAGAPYPSGPLSGEILGIFGSDNPDSVDEALTAAVRSLRQEICFYEPEGGGPAFFPHVITETGTYLSTEAGIEPGAPMAYLIAPPIEAVIAMDAALKAAEVTLVKHFDPPTETNFGGGYLAGELHALEASARAFTEAVLEVATRPQQGLRRPAHDRR